MSKDTTSTPGRGRSAEGACSAASRVEKLLDAAFSVLAHDCDPDDRGSILQREALKERFAKIIGRPNAPISAEEARYASLPHALWWGSGWWRAGRKISETLNLSDRKQRARFKKSSARWRAAMMRQGAAKHAAVRHNAPCAGSATKNTEEPKA